jgi:hypothetical protein
MMIIIFWEMTPCGSYKKSPTSLCLYKSLQLRSVTCSHSCTLTMEAIRSSETSVLIRATRCHLPEDDNHHGKIVVLRKFSQVCKFWEAGNFACFRGGGGGDRMSF